MKPYVVGVAGGSGAGKTALTRALASALAPAEVAVLAHDAYYGDRRHLDPAERSRLDFDTPEAFDHELFRAHLAALRRGEPIAPPRYCFVTHCRLGADEPVKPGEVVLVEGLFLLHDPGVRQLLDLRIYVEAPVDVRLARRVRRDVAERGRTAESVVAQFRDTVVPAHARHIEPTRVYADLVLVNAGRLGAVVEVAAAVIRARQSGSGGRACAA